MSLSLLLRAHAAPVWTPGLIQPYAWFDAAQESFNNGDAVGTWTNRGSGAGNLTSSGTNRPTFKTSIINGKPVLRFDTNDYLSVASFNPMSSALTVWAVFTAPSGTDRIIAELSSNFTANEGWIFYRTSANTVAFSESTEFGNYSAFTTTGTATTSPSVFVGTVDRSLSTNETAGYLNSRTSTGTVSPNYNFAASVFPSNTLYVGARGGSSLFFGGSTTADLAEFGVCASALGTTDRTLLLAYLGSKYGIAIS